MDESFAAEALREIDDSSHGRHAIRSGSARGREDYYVLGPYTCRLAGLEKPLREEIHGGRPYEPGDEFVGRPLVDFERRGDLPYAAGVHYDYALAHRHRLRLVVRHVYHRRAEPVVEAYYLRAHFDAHLRVEVGKRLVEEKDRGLAHYRAPERDPLPLPAGERLRKAFHVGGEPERLGGRRYAPFDFGLRIFPQLQGEGHVLLDRHVRVEGVVLENHRDVAVLRRKARDVLAADHYRPARDRLEARDHPESRGLAAPRRSHEDEKFAVPHREREVFHGRVAAAGVDFPHMLEDDVRHLFSPLSRA